MPPRGRFKKTIVVGDVFGKLTVQDGPHYNTGRDALGKPYWRCKCICGKDHWVCHGNLLNGSTQSCGCYQSERRGKTLHLHGESANSKTGKKASSEFIAWCSMRARCNNPNSTDYKNYGGRGIVVCDRWTESFSNFLEDMGRKPTAGHSLDREDVNGPYSFDNCRWATSEQQALNKANSIRLTMNGESLPIVEWSRRTGLSQDLLRKRRSKGWSDERILTTKLFPTGNHVHAEQPVP